jgi:hypothetical protein
MFKQKYHVTKNKNPWSIKPIYRTIYFWCIEYVAFPLHVFSYLLTSFSFFKKTVQDSEIIELLERWSRALFYPVHLDYFCPRQRSISITQNKTMFLQTVFLPKISTLANDIYVASYRKHSSLLLLLGWSVCTDIVLSSSPSNVVLS